MATGLLERSRNRMIKTSSSRPNLRGEVPVQGPAPPEIKSDQPPHVGLKNGQTVVGLVSTADGKLEVSTKTARNVEAP